MSFKLTLSTNDAYHKLVSLSAVHEFPLSNKVWMEWHNRGGQSFLMTLSHGSIYISYGHLNKCLIPCTKERVQDPNQCFCLIHLHAVPEFSAPLQTPVYNIALFITIFQQSFCHSSNTVTAGAPLFSVLLGWKLLLILTQHFLRVLHNKCESSSEPCEPLWKVSTMPSSLADVGKLVWSITRTKQVLSHLWQSKTKESRSGSTEDWYYILWATINFYLVQKKKYIFYRSYATEQFDLGLQTKISQYRVSHTDEVVWRGADAFAKLSQASKKDVIISTGSDHIYLQ